MQFTEYWTKSGNTSHLYCFNTVTSNSEVKDHLTNKLLELFLGLVIVLLFRLFGCGG